MCVVADDSVFLPIAIAHLSKTSHIISLFPGLKEKGAQYLQAVAAANGFSMDRVEVLKKRVSQLTMHDTYQKKVSSTQASLFTSPIFYLLGLPTKHLVVHKIVLGKSNIHEFIFFKLL